MNEVERLLGKSRRDLEASRILLREGFFDQSASRSYYAAFRTAEAVLAELGVTRSKHSGVISAFGKAAVREGGLDPQFGALLRSLFDTRNDADYGAGSTTMRDATEAIEEAERFVDAVTSWLDERGSRTD